MRSARAPPSTRDVVPGARVDIVLKADQGTGRTVSGTVSAVLTRGNHPRGIKVRLADGRVGRVQGMAGGDGPAAQADRAMEPEEPAVPRQEVGLGDYVVAAASKRPGRRRRNGTGRTGQTVQQGSGESRRDGAGETVNTATATCPVCGDFSGDETAVGHHVAKHFDE